MKKHCIIILVLLGLFAFPQNGSAQRKRAYRGAPNLPYYDSKRIHFGFLIGYNSADFAIKAKTDLNEFDSLMVISTSPMSGFNVGMVADLRLGNYFNLRFTPQISLLDRVVNYNLLYNGTTMHKVSKRTESVSLDFPLIIKLKSSRMHNCRVYVITGAQYSIDLASIAQKKYRDSELVHLRLLRSDVQALAGAGIDFYLLYFKFGIELKMSFGVLDLLKKEDNLFSKSVDRLNSKIFHISFLFE